MLMTLQLILHDRNVINLSPEPRYLNSYESGKIPS